MRIKQTLSNTVLQPLMPFCHCRNKHVFFWHGACWVILAHPLQMPPTFEYIQCERSNGDPHHRLWMLEKLDCLSVQREIIGVLVIEEVYRMRGQFEWECFDERDIIRHDFFVAEVELVHNYCVHVVVRQQIICKLISRSHKLIQLSSRA